jgi:hypothetical protein
MASSNDKVTVIVLKDGVVSVDKDAAPLPKRKASVLGLTPLQVEELIKSKQAR